MSDDSPANLPLMSSRSSLLRAEVLWPVLLVGGLWLVMSLGTNAYLNWVETEYSRLFDDNLDALRLTNQAESEIWRLSLAMELPLAEPELLKARSCAVRELASEMARFQQLEAANLRLASSTFQATMIGFLNVLDAAETGDRGEFSGEELQVRLQGFAAEVSRAAAEFRTLNADWISGRRRMLTELKSRVVFLRLLILLLGLPIGILLGWRVARRLKSTAARIAVTLNETAAVDHLPGMTVQITRGSSFEDVQLQAERVVKRLRSVVGELQSARREVIQSERLAAVGELAAGVAHELRNPLTSVKLLLQHAARQPGDYRINEQKLQLILEEIRRMESTIQGLLDFSRQPDLKRLRHDLRETIRRSLNLADGRLRQQRLEVEANLGHRPLWIMADPELLNQVFVNLLLNAIEASPDGGRLSVSAELLDNSDRVRVSVSDTGSGFRSDILQKIFEPFATTKEKGTGLGLAICRRIVTEHGGQIQAANSPFGGAIVMVELPLDSLGEISSVKDQRAEAMALSTGGVPATPKAVAL